MKELDIVIHIQKRQKEKQDLLGFLDYLEKLNEAVPLKEETMFDIKTKLSSRLAFIERSIIDHEKLLTNEQH